VDKSTPFKNNSGFTLLETLIAMTIMLVSFSAIFLVESGSIRAIQYSKQTTIVSMLLKKSLLDTEELIKNKTFSEIDKEKEGKFEEPYQNYSWKRKIEEIEFPEMNFSDGSSDKEGQENAENTKMVGQIISKFISKSLRKITVTITGPKGKRTQSDSISTFWVNLNNEMQLTP